MKKIFSLVTVALLGLFLLVSCGTKYTVSFDTKGGSEIEDVAVAEGKTLTLPADPTKEGAEFSGWYVDDKCREEYDATKPVIKDFTLYAKWLVTITFDSMGGSAVESVKGVFNDIVSPTGMPAPTKDGYVFMGWYRDQEYTQEQPNLFPKSSLTLYAKWGVTDASTALNFNTWIVNDKDQYSYKINEDGSHTFATVDPSLVLEKYGGEWDGLTTKTTGKDIKDMKSLTVEVEAKKGQKVLLKVNDQNSGEKWVEFTEDGKQTVKITLATDLPNLVIDEAKTALAILAGAGVNARSGEFKFTKIEFSNDAEGDALKTVNLLNSQWNDNVSYVFNLYKTTGTYSFVKTMIEHNVSKYNAISMTIVGTKDKEILLKLEGGSIESNVEKVFKMTGEEQTINWVVSEANLTKTGGEMFLWFLNPGVEGAGAEVTIKAASLVKLVDIGKDNKQATIFFNEKGGSKVADITANIGAAVTAPTAPTRNGYTFAGWFADEACTTAYTFDKMGNKSVEVYAKWDKVSYEVTFNNNGKGEAVEKQTVGFLPALPELEAEGFVLKGWYYDAEFSKEAKEGDAVNENTTLYAKWEEANPDPISVNLLTQNYTPLNDTVTATYENGVLKLEKLATGGNWESAKSVELANVLVGTNILKVSFKGVAGKNIIFKVNDKAEFRHTCTGEVEYLELVFDIELNEANAALFIMPGADVAGPSGVYEVYSIEAANYHSKVNLLTQNYTPLNDTVTATYQNGVLKLEKSATGGNWESAKSVELGNVLKGFNVLKVSFKGVAGKTIIFKVNDKAEFRVTCTGEVQYVELPYNIELNEGNAALFIMPGADVAGPSGVYEIYSIFAATEYDHVDLINGWEENVASSYAISAENGVLKIQKTLASAWDYAKLDITKLEANKYTTIVIKIKGEAGDNMTIKLNDDNAYQIFVNSDGTVQTYTFTMPTGKFIDPAKPLLIFAAAGKDAASGTFEITEMYLK